MFPQSSSWKKIYKWLGIFGNNVLIIRGPSDDIHWLTKMRQLYLKCASLDHNLLSLWLYPWQGKELSLEDHWRFFCVQLYCIKLLFSPFHIHWGNKRETKTQVCVKTKPASGSGGHLWCIMSCQVMNDTAQSYVRVITFVMQRMVWNRSRMFWLC